MLEDIAPSSTHHKMNSVLNINTDEVVKFTAKLEKMHRSALPVAIRTALNSAAFDVKKSTMPASAERTFTNREKNFFKANSKVEMARGFNVKSMQATVGFSEQSLKGSTNYAVKDLEQQEYGGTIDSKSFIPMDPARGGNKVRPVRPVNRLATINKLTNSQKGSGKSLKNKFIRSAIAAGVGGYVLGNFVRKQLFRVDDIKKKRGKTFIKKTPLYSYEENRTVTVKATGFMREASLQSGNKIEKYYIREAEKQFKRLAR